MRTAAEVVAAIILGSLIGGACLAIASSLFVRYLIGA